MDDGRPAAAGGNGRTDFAKETRICPYCGSEERMTHWRVVDAQADPDLREALLRKELQVLDCGNCGRHFVLSEPLLYVDDGARLALFVHPEADGSDDLRSLSPAALPAFPGADGAWMLRLCGDYNALIEKIHLREAGLDDRVMEGVKLALAARLLSEEGKRTEDLRFLAADGEGLLFFARYALPPDDGAEAEGEAPADARPETETLEFSRALYENAVQVLTPRLAALPTWAVVDATYARGLIDACG